MGTHHPRVLILVLGDVGRSPRMQYHALSLLNNGYDVTLSGYEGSELIPLLDNHNTTSSQSANAKAKGYLKITRYKVSLPFENAKLLRASPLLMPIYYVLRLISLLCMPIAAYIFSGAYGYDYILVQTPPAIPSLLIAYTLKHLSLLTSSRPTKLVIDWHNIGYTMFPPSSSLIRKLCKSHEVFVQKWLVDECICVSEGMKVWLHDNFGGKGCVVLHDRPPSMFKTTDVDVAHELMMRLEGDFEGARLLFNSSSSDNKGDDDTVESTLFTTKNANGECKWKKNRPKILVSSTSWTQDEDFSILLNALIKLDSLVTNSNDTKSFPNIICIVTGKGPQKAMYEATISKVNLSKIHIMTVWLHSSDYPLLIGCADLGVSLHTSTSGIDLPMKIVDMFGCNVPVVSVYYECISELVKEGVNGRVCKTFEEMSEVFFELFGDAELKELERLREGVKGGVGWEENWDDVMLKRVFKFCDEKTNQSTKSTARTVVRAIFMGVMAVVLLSFRKYLRT